jgi:hypothetical protein
MFLTITVLALVPSVFQSSYPLVPSVAAKSKLLPIAPIGYGLELAVPVVVFISLTWVTVAPSVFHNSDPVPLFAEKYSVLETTKKLEGDELVFAAVLIFENNELFAALGVVVLIRQSSLPFTPSFAE